MVTPNQKRVAVAQLVAEFGVSQRRACLVVNQHRSTQRHCTTRSEEERALRSRIRALAVKYPRYGYRRIHVMLLRDGFVVIRKRVQRLWRAEGLLVQRPKKRKPTARRNPIVVRGAHPNIESFNSRLRDELLTLETFDSMWEIRFMLEEHRKNHNHYRPHSALGYMTPVEFATKWRDENAVLLSQEVDQ